jgi:hypothetical protein
VNETANEVKVSLRDGERIAKIVSELYNGHQITVAKIIETANCRGRTIEIVRFVGYVDGVCEFSGMQKDRASFKYAAYYCKTYGVKA